MTLLLLLVYANPKRDDGEFHVWPNNKTLAEQFGCQPRQVAKILESLENKKAIVRDCEPGTSRKIDILIRFEGMEEGLPEEYEDQVAAARSRR